MDWQMVVVAAPVLAYVTDYILDANYDFVISQASEASYRWLYGTYTRLAKEEVGWGFRGSCGLVPLSFVILIDSASAQVESQPLRP